MIKHNIARVGVAILGLAAGVYLVSSSSEASAAGCNGVVDPFKWGCAAWDNNNGPQFPHYKPPKKAAKPAKIAPGRAAPAPQAQRPVVAPNNANRIITHDGSSLIGNDAGSLRRR